MKIIKLDESIKDAVLKLFTQSKEMKAGVKSIVAEIGATETMVWQLINEAHPETANKRCVHSSVRPGEIIVLDKKHDSERMLIEKAMESAMESGNYSLVQELKKISDKHLGETE